eukprot:TRINITY_DN13284_c0_g2_i1.p1 TRINITY_DN13284_c0_g2~~TRINITY_DN13284_c0_g2_i1.p1  ORF type:complete len:186 (+),score=57.59 TRINITY_DN13284_c0_g2_i1:63-620(+)
MCIRDSNIIEYINVVEKVAYIQDLMDQSHKLAEEVNKLFDKDSHQKESIETLTSLAERIWRFPLRMTDFYNELKKQFDLYQTLHQYANEGKIDDFEREAPNSIINLEKERKLIEMHKKRFKDNKGKIEKISKLKNKIFEAILGGRRVSGYEEFREELENLQSSGPEVPAEYTSDFDVYFLSLIHI